MSSAITELGKKMASSASELEEMQSAFGASGGAAGSSLIGKHIAAVNKDMDLPKRRSLGQVMSGIKKKDLPQGLKMPKSGAYLLGVKAAGTQEDVAADLAKPMPNYPEPVNEMFGKFMKATDLVNKANAGRSRFDIKHLLAGIKPEQVSGGLKNIDPKAFTSGYKWPGAR